MTSSISIPGGMERIAGSRFSLPYTHRFLIAFWAGAAYYLGAIIGFALTFPTHAVSTLWPPNAILLACLLLTPTRKWWLVLLGVFPAHVAVQLQSGVPTLMILCWFVSNTSEALIGAYCIRWLIGSPLKFDNFWDAGVFMIFAVFLAPFVSSFMDAAFVVLVGWKEGAYWQVWRMRFTANVLAELALVPFIVLWATNGVAWLRRASLQRYAEACLLACGLLTISVLVFSWQDAGPGTAPALVYLPLPFLLWATVRFGPAGASTSLLVVVLVSIWAATQGRGPFISRSPAENVLSLQIFLIAVSLPLIFLAVLVEERRGKEKALRESEARYRALVMASTDMVWRAGADGRGLFVDPSWQKLTGQTEAEMRDFGWLDVVHPDDREPSRRLWQQAIDEKLAYENEFRVRTRVGSYHVLHVHAVPIVTNHGRVYEWVGANTDITDRRRAEEALRESEERLARTEKFSLVMITHTDLEGRWLKVPPTLCELLGYTEKELLGRRFHEVTHPDDIEANSTQRLRLIRGEIKSFDLEKRYIRKDGSIVWVYLNVSAVTDAKGTPVHFLGYIRDITERKRTESELRRQRDELAHVTRISTMGELAASLAHELNQPLTAILSNAQAAQHFLTSNPVDLGEVREILSDIVQDNDRAIEVIRRMRALVKKEKPDLAPIDLGNVIRDVVLLLHSDAVLRNIRVSLDLSPGLPPVQADKIELQQVALNLLLNAFDATSDCPANQRHVVLKVESDSTGLVKVAVRDWGTGLGSDKLDKIFEPFYTTKPEGLGMGLSISRTIIEAHGGRLWAENNSDHGATFYFTVPVKGGRNE